MEKSQTLLPRHARTHANKYTNMVMVIMQNFTIYNHFTPSMCAFVCMVGSDPATAKRKNLFSHASNLQKHM